MGMRRCPKASNLLLRLPDLAHSKLAIREKAHVVFQAVRGVPALLKTTNGPVVLLRGGHGRRFESDQDAHGDLRLGSWQPLTDPRTSHIFRSERGGLRGIAPKGGRAERARRRPTRGTAHTPP